MSNFRIVIADDDEDDYLIIKETFNEFIKHDLFRVSDGQQLMDYLHHKIKSYENLPDLILLDINMPMMNGIQALELIKTSESLKHIPVIMYSTTSDPDQMKLCEQMGANGFIPKAYNHKEMVRNVTNINTFLQDLLSDSSIQLFIR